MLLTELMSCLLLLLSVCAGALRVSPVHFDFTQQAQHCMM